MPKLDRTGKVYGNYKVTSQATNDDKGNVRWFATCLVCGSTRTRLSREFKTEKITQNCPDCFWKRTYKGYEEISGTYWSRVKKQADDRDISFNLTIEQAWDLFLQQDRICAYSGSVLTFSRGKMSSQTASLDSINSSEGYSKENVQWIHKDLNVMKGKRSHLDFMKLCNSVREPRMEEIL